MSAIRFDTERMRQAADAMLTIGPPAYADAQAVCTDHRIAMLTGHIRGAVTEVVLHAAVIVETAKEQIDHESRGLRYRAALAELFDGRADAQTFRDLEEMAEFLTRVGGALTGQLVGASSSTADVALFLDLYGELEESGPQLFAALETGGALGTIAGGFTKGAKYIEEHGAANKLLKVLSAFNVLHTAAVQYRDSAAETDMGRVSSALSVAIASGAIGVVTVGVGKIVIGVDNLVGLKLVDGTLAGRSDEQITALERQFTGDDASVQRFESQAREWDYGPMVRGEQVVRDAQHAVARSVDRFVDDRVRDIRSSLGHPDHEGSGGW